MHPFDSDTRVDPVADGAYAATVTDRWNALGGGANGGYLLAICLQALLDRLPFPDPLVVSAFYLRPGQPGPAEVRTELVRAGRRVATGEAHLLQEGRELLRVLATFADLDRADGRTEMLATAPRLPAPEQAIDLMNGASVPGLTIADRFEYRGAQLPGWVTGRPTGDPRLEFWLRFKEQGRHADTLALPALVDAAAPAVLELGEPTSTTVELTVHVRGRPAPGWLACRVATRHLIGGYHEEDFEIWDSEGRLVAQSRQLGLLV